MSAKFSELFRQVATLDQVVGIGHGHKLIRGQNTGREAVVVLVQKKLKKNDLLRNERIPSALAGLPTDVIEVGNIRLLQANRTDMIRPAQPGISLGHYQVSAGTFGAVVYDRKTQEPFILSNNHVLANLTNGSDGRSKKGDLITQPGIYDGASLSLDKIAIGHLERFIPLSMELITPQCPIAQFFETAINKIIKAFRPQYKVQVWRQSGKENLADCAVAKPIDKSSISPDIMEIGPVQGIKEAVAGLEIKKSGRTTGVTQSTVLATDVTLKISINSNEYAVFSEQILAGPMSKPGDSGSLILTLDNYAIGLLFAGSDQATLFNKIEHVLQLLDVTLLL